MIRFTLAILLTFIVGIVSAYIAYYAGVSPEGVMINGIIFLHFWSALKE